MSSQLPITKEQLRKPSSRKGPQHALGIGMWIDGVEYRLRNLGSPRGLMVRRIDTSNTYFLRRQGKHLSCTCPSYTSRGEACKHVKAFTALWVHLCGWYGENTTEEEREKEEKVRIKG